MNEFQRGSEWRRWDLHVHTPFTRKEDGFTWCEDSSKTEEEKTSEKWTYFFNSILNYVGDMSNPLKAIYAIGITDYFSIDNYRKVISNADIVAKIPLILPNVELRILPAATEAPINLHCIFDPSLSTNEIENDFLSKLKFIYNNKPYSATKSSLIQLGKAIDSNIIDDFTAEKKALEQYVVNISDLQELYNNNYNLRRKTIIAISNKSTDGASGIGNVSISNDSSDLTSLREELYKFADVIFSGNPNDVEYFLGKKNGISADDVKKKCGKLMPCLHGSDAHNIDSLFEPYQKRYCWIKADPTFNGLRQIIYEPEERVCISATKPEQKPDYFVIERVEILDDDFQPEPIYFNDKLNCIIGGKSTGKSILLHNLAIALDTVQVNEKDKTSQTRTKTDLNLTVYWADGKNEKDYPLGERKIIYIPQTYLNKLCDIQTEKTEIDKIIQNIILLNTEANRAFINVINEIKNYKADLSKTILDLLEFHRAINDITQQIKEIGDKTGIESEKDKLINEKEYLTKESSLTDEEVTSYETAMAQISLLTSEVKYIEEELAEMKIISSLVEPKKITYNFSEQVKIAIEKAQIEIISESNKKWEELRNTIFSSLDSIKKTKNDELEKHQATVLELKEKIQSNKAIAELTAKIKIESEKLAKIAQLLKQKNDKQQEKSKLLNEVVSSIEYFKNQHILFADTINNNADLQTKDLEFSVDVPFKKEAFIEKMKNIMDVGRKSFKEIISPDEFTPASYTKEKIQEIIEKILTEELILKKDNTIESAIRDILDDWFEVKYRVTMSGDSIDIMSPGKKALVLLKLLIELAESKCPILIDQPEDDLDNRSIFNELIGFIKKKKKERQIIIVTHNANIVVGADAEEIIVANQNGNDAPNKLKRFEYRSGAIENDTAIFKCNGNEEDGILNGQGIQQHIYYILEGGPRAFELRRKKYHI